MDDPVLLSSVPVDYSERGIFRSGLKMSHLQLILAIEDHGQISAAAESLSISQPAASRMLGEVEAILKAPLCARVARGVELTQYGRALARRARTVFLELRETAREINELRTGSGGSVSLGSVTGPAINLAVPAIRQVSTAYPGIEISIQIENSNVLVRELQSARHDFVIGRIPDDMDPRQFNLIEIGEEDVCLIVREGHPLLEKGIVTAADLPGYDWVFQPSGTLLRRAVEDSFLSAGTPLPATIINTSSIILTISIVRNTNAIAPVARDVAALVAGKGGQSGEIRILPTDFNIKIRPYSLITARGRALPPSAKLLYDLILKQSTA
ncbi:MULTISPECIES: LysR family transcriptional regulator [unclassified Rhizobium]|uniref:LysR family transcriptional regulator n=1 Tax=unclassified Rhizobium TaxID=2613769 RepID=UPI0007156200|nr:MULTISPECIES: LysR family transcriptional regulator [unclassified Rhizobium]KQS84762.1 LysR family transcriptional regulator [Rhizobium sp. Leaf386]KQT05289.1 LysR family transcriptional regulator [Rhizobium sp. Leaf391]KQT91731.1 LysR family transcriptional regulator [Rhizobium sp. Leaf453]